MVSASDFRSDGQKIGGSVVRDQVDLFMAVFFLSQETLFHISLLN